MTSQSIKSAELVTFQGAFTYTWYQSSLPVDQGLVIGKAFSENIFFPLRSLLCKSCKFFRKVFHRILNHTFMLHKGKWWEEGKPQLEWHHLKTVSRKRPEWRTSVSGVLPWPLFWILRGREGRTSCEACGQGLCWTQFLSGVVEILCKVSGLDMLVPLTAGPWPTQVNETTQRLTGPVSCYTYDWPVLLNLWDSWYHPCFILICTSFKSKLYVIHYSYTQLFSFNI